jgi:hypothetical protein
MPASLTYYSEKTSSNIQPEFISGELDYALFQDFFNLYDKNNNVIGSVTDTGTFVRNPSGDIIVNTNSYIKFNELSGFPYGDDNILSCTFTYVNKVDLTNSQLLEGTYTGASNSCSTGEYLNQVAYSQFTRDNSQKYDKVTVNFPLPILTYTNAFNSLPQPSVAPLPA